LHSSIDSEIGQCASNDSAGEPEILATENISLESNRIDGGGDNSVNIPPEPLKPHHRAQPYSFSQRAGMHYPSRRIRPVPKRILATPFLTVLDRGVKEYFSIDIGKASWALALVQRTRWFVFKLSICFLNRTVHKSLHRNLMTSRLSVNRGRSRENLFTREGGH
jgi:hypothetical protein